MSNSTGVAIMSKTFFTRLAGRFDFPRNYTCVDIETSGLSPTNNLICSIGHTVVRDCKPVQTALSYLNWTSELAIDQAQLIYDLNQVKEHMEAKGKTFLHPYSTLKEIGRPPRVVLNEYLSLFEDMEEREEIMVCHNGFSFDVPFIENAISRWVLSASKERFEFNPDLVYDTGIIEKASQLPLDGVIDPLPGADETMQDFARRIRSIRMRGIYWALDGYCNEKYGLMEKAGVDMSMAHAADTDSLLTHHLLEEQRKQAYGEN